MPDSKQLIVTLKKVPNGYTFQSVTSTPLPKASKNKSASKSKKNKDPKSKPNSSRSTLAQKLIREIGIPQEQVSGHAERQNKELTDTNKESSTFPDRSGEEVVPPLPYAPELSGLLKAIPEEDSIELDLDKQLPKCPATWFSLEKVSEREREELPQFFQENSTNHYKNQALYTKWRNFMVIAYESNPKIYLTKTACRKTLRGDSCAIIRVHEFLAKHGIINYGISPDRIESFEAKPAYNQLKKPSKNITLSEVSEESKVTDANQQDLVTNNIYKAFSRTLRSYCSTCKLPCGIAYFIEKESTMESGYSYMCHDCYSQLTGVKQQCYEKYNLVKKAEQVINSKNNSIKSSWNFEENVKLLKAFSEDNSTWKSIMEQYDGKKNVEEIILQFLQFPILNFKPQRDNIPDQQNFDQGIIQTNLIKNLHKQKEKKSKNQKIASEAITQNESQMKEILNELLEGFKSKIAAIGNLEMKSLQLQKQLPHPECDEN